MDMKNMLETMALRAGWYDDEKHIDYGAKLNEQGDELVVWWQQYDDEGDIVDSGSVTLIVVSTN